MDTKKAVHYNGDIYPNNGTWENIKVCRLCSSASNIHAYCCPTCGSIAGWTETPGLWHPAVYQQMGIIRKILYFTFGKDVPIVQPGYWETRKVI